MRAVRFPMSASPLASASVWRTARKKGLWVRETKAPSSCIGGWICGVAYTRYDLRRVVAIRDSRLPVRIRLIVLLNRHL